MSKVTVVILTYNEEKNIAQALDSVSGWADRVFLLDSFSTDQTLNIAAKYDCRIFQNKFEGYSEQRNYALKKLPIDTEWMMFLDADEWLTAELKEEIKAIIAAGPEPNGYFIKFRFLWMGRWIRRGYYPTWILRLFRHQKARCGNRSFSEHLIVEGKTGYLKHDFIHEDKKGIGAWISKHDHYAALEAMELLKQENARDEIKASFFGSQAQRKSWIRYRVWNRLPPLIRPWLYFIYRYFICGGFLEGRRALIYHFLQALWFPMLIDIKYLEIKMSLAGRKSKKHQEMGNQ